MLSIKTGDFLNVGQGIICHQVNCRHVAGAGLALQIRHRWPQWYLDFRAATSKLGTASFFEVEPSLFVANLYAQDGYGRKGRHTNYPAFRHCLKHVAQFANLHDLQVHLPVGIGCGLAGGDWSIVQAIIAQELPKAILIEKTT